MASLDVHLALDKENTVARDASLLHNKAGASKTTLHTNNESMHKVGAKSRAFGVRFEGNMTTPRKALGDVKNVMSNGSGLHSDLKKTPAAEKRMFAVPSVPVSNKNKEPEVYDSPEICGYVPYEEEPDGSTLGPKDERLSSLPPSMLMNALQSRFFGWDEELKRMDAEELAEMQAKSVEELSADADAILAELTAGFNDFC